MKILSRGKTRLLILQGLVQQKKNITKTQCTSIFLNIWNLRPHNLVQTSHSREKHDFLPKLTREHIIKFIKRPLSYIYGTKVTDFVFRN